MKFALDTDYSNSSFFNSTFVNTKHVITRNLVIGVFGVIGNVLAALLLLVNRHVKLSLRVTIIGLTLNDLCFALAASMFANNRWSWRRSEDFYCWPVMYVALSSIITSYLVTCLLALHNYVAVFIPLRCNHIMTDVRSVLAVAAAWLLGYSIALGSSGTQPPRGRPCVLIAIIPRGGLALACSVCLIASSVVVGINITICWKLRNRRKVMCSSWTQPKGFTQSSGSGTRRSMIPMGITSRKQEWTNRLRKSASNTNLARTSTSSMAIASEAVSLSKNNIMASPLQKLDDTKHEADCTNSKNVKGLCSDFKVDEDVIEHRLNQTTIRKSSNVNQTIPYVSKLYNSYEKQNNILSPCKYELKSTALSTGKAAKIYSDANRDVNHYTTAAIDILHCTETSQQLNVASLSTLPGYINSKGYLNKSTLFTDNDRNKNSAPVISNYGSLFICHSTQSQLHPERRQTGPCRTAPGEPHLGKQQSRTNGRIASTSNTLVLLTLWSCLLTLPLIIYITYATIRSSDLQGFSTSSFGILVSSVCVAHSFTNPLLYAWRFTTWRKARCRKCLC